MASITKKQIAKTWALTRELKWSEDLLYCAVYRISGGKSISGLTKQQGIELIDYLISQKQNTKYRPGMATQKQIWLINKLADELGWSSTPKRLQRFIRKYAKVDNPNWLTVRMASNIIEALKAMVKRHNEGQEGHDGGTTTAN
jgi:hypothetical protein